MNSIKEIIEVVDICNKWFGRKMALEDELRVDFIKDLGCLHPLIFES